MKRYLAISAVRIQTWIARTPSLKLARGASAALSECTQSHNIDTTLGPFNEPVQRSTEAGQIDGVVVLEFPDSVDIATVDRVRESLLDYVHAKLPGIEWESWTEVADTYVAAYDKAFEVGRSRQVSLPSRTDLPLSATCGGCRLEPLVVGGSTLDLPNDDGVDEPTALGPDCAARLAHSTPEALRKAAAYELHPVTAGVPAETFDELAARGGVIPGITPNAIGAGDRRNHLATIAADGNNVGAIFKAIRSIGDPRVGADAAAVLTDATQEAVAKASVEVTGAADVRAVIKHVAGGDDVLVSVPAWCAWPFVIALATTFEYTFQHLLPVLAGSAPSDASEHFEQVVGRVSLGIGVCFSNRRYPFAQAHRMATRAMGVAKTAVRGRKGAASWIDLTVEHTIPPGRHRTISELRELQAGIAAEPVLHLNATARATIAQMLHAASHDRASNPPEIVGRRLRQWADRTQEADRDQVPALVTAFTELEATARRDPAAGAEELARLADTLCLARWWPEAPTTRTVSA
jgi:hypothetical protein